MAGSRMDEDDVLLRFNALHDNARDKRDELEDERDDLTDAYDGKGYREVEGRARVVDRSVRDSIQLAMPSIMRLLFGAQRMMELTPTRPDQSDEMHKATRYVTQLITENPDSYHHIYSAMMDAVLRKTGYLKVYHDESVDIRSSKYTGITPEQLQVLAEDDNVEIAELEEYQEKRTVPPQELQRRTQEAQQKYQQQMQQALQPQMQQVQQQAQQMGQQGQQWAQQQMQALQQQYQQQHQPPQPVQNPVTLDLCDVTLTRRDSSNRVNFCAVPPGEILISAGAHTIHEADFVAHARNVSMSDLRRMGYSDDDLEDVSGTDEDMDDDSSDWQSEYNYQDENGFDDGAVESESDPSSERVYYVEAWVRMDVDGDGIAELRRICTAGSGKKVLINEYANHCRIASMTPSIVPHSAFGESLAELVTDVQDVKTAIMRNLLDSYSKSVNPDTIALEGHVNYDDLANPEPGRVIRVRQLGAIQYQSEPFNGERAYPLLEYMGNLVQQRTGLNETSQGLNADNLQSTSNVAIDAAVQASQGRIELICRTLIETGIKHFFRLMYLETIENVNQSSFMQTNGSWIEFDARNWDVNARVTTKATIGSGTIQQQIQHLSMIAQKQEMILQQLGPDNQLAGFKELHNTYAEISRLMGINDPDSFFKDPATQPPPQPKPQQPDPQVIQAQTAQMKAQADIQNDKAKLQQQAQHDAQQLQLQREKIQLDAQMKLAGISTNYQQHADNIDMQRGQQAIEAFKQSNEQERQANEQHNRDRDFMAEQTRDMLDRSERHDNDSADRMERQRNNDTSNPEGE